jgi:hypothetical protein
MTSPQQLREQAIDQLAQYAQAMGKSETDAQALAEYGVRKVEEHTGGGPRGTWQMRCHCDMPASHMVDRRCYCDQHVPRNENS